MAGVDVEKITQEPAAAAPPRTRRARRSIWTRIGRNWQLYVMLALPLAFVAIFLYWPMYGLQIAFRDYNIVQGITGSPWVGLAHFTRFIHSYEFLGLIRNTVVLHIYELVVGFPLPIMLALALNYVRLAWYRRTFQMISYVPHFISTVVIVGILFTLFDPRTGGINLVLNKIHIGPIDLMGDPGLFRHAYVWSGVWQNIGFDTLIYLAALTAVNPELHEAAIMDGASKLRRMWHIDLPSITPIAVLVLVLNMSSVFSVGFEKVFLMQTPLNFGQSEVIQTYVYKVGLQAQLPQFSYAAAIGLFQGVVSFILLIIGYLIVRRLPRAGLD